MDKPPSPAMTLKAGLVLLLWFAAACVLGFSGKVAFLRPPLPQVVLSGLVAALLLANGLLPGLREWLRAIPLSWLVAVHLTRFAGFYFLWLHEHKELPYAFAVPGGVGDVIVASLAASLMTLRPASRWAYAAWNTLGLIDILFVVITAARLALANPESMAALLRLPLCLLPTFIVPLIIFSHIVIFERLGGEHAGGAY